METMNRAKASCILGIDDAGELLAFKETKAYKIWAFEGGIVKQMGRRVFGWIPDLGAAVFAVDNKLPLDVRRDHPAIVEAFHVCDIWNNQGRAKALEYIKTKESKA